MGRVNRTPGTETIQPPLAYLLGITPARRDFDSRKASRDTAVDSRVNPVLPGVSRREVRAFIPREIAMVGPILLNLRECPKVSRVELNVHAGNRARVLGQRFTQHVSPRFNTSFRYVSTDHWLRRPPPTLGQHNREILLGLLGLSAAELDDLEQGEVIGTRPKGV